MKSIKKLNLFLMRRIISRKIHNRYGSVRDITFIAKADTYYNVFLIHLTKNVKNFIKKSSTRRKGEQFTIGMLKSALPHC
ncbi:hypothetical protein HMPREF9554_02204 [Treponema phagedenis F0421]|nr:hypothetical protein HMPREF9554_02204 [Treponema phagedenis F0421]